MGVMNLRAICPNCGGKIHTQPKGFGHFTWARSWFLVQTGTTCQHCGVALSGKVKADNKAELASEAQLRTQKKAAKPSLWGAVLGLDPRVSLSSWAFLMPEEDSKARRGLAVDDGSPLVCNLATG